MNHQSEVNEQELNKYRQMLQDAANMTPYIPEDLRMKLEVCLDDDVRMLVLELQIVAIQYGRALERLDQHKIDANSVSRLHETSKLVKQIVSRSGEALSSNKNPVEVPKQKELDLLIVPGQHLPRKV